MIPKPNLDDRTHRQIMEEAIRLIPQYCPEWTNHNPNDPGIALLELFAWMMEMGLYRLNRVPEKTYLTLMELMGIQLKSAQAAKVLVRFALAEGRQKQQWVPLGTSVATAQTEETDAVVFETSRPLLVTDVRLERCVSVEDDRVSDNSGIVAREESTAAFPVFQSHTPMERSLYIGDSQLEMLKDAMQVNISLKTGSVLEAPISSLLAWEYYNGRRWVEAEPLSGFGQQPDRYNQFVFQGPLVGIAAVEVAGLEKIWLRAKLLLRPVHPRQAAVLSAGVKTVLSTEGLAPEMCFANAESQLFEVLDLSKDFHPFSKKPKFNDAFYLACRTIFAKAGARVTLSVTFTTNPSIPKPQASEDLMIAWEYWDGQNWRNLGNSRCQPGVEPEGEHAFLDSTAALTQEGEITFIAPADWSPGSVNQIENYWLRARLLTGDFGVGGNYVQNEKGEWIWNFDRPLLPPVLSKLSLRYALEEKPAQALVAVNAGQSKDASAVCAENFQLLQDGKPPKPADLFTWQLEKNPVCYFGFSDPFPAEEQQLYFLLKDSEVFAGQDGEEAPVTLAWEYWNGQAWHALAVQDHTLGLSHSGLLLFTGPKDIAASELWGSRQYWLRARLEYGSYEKIPYLSRVWTNVVEANSWRTIRNEILGSSDGAPGQGFSLLQTPVVGNPEIWIIEPNLASSPELESFMRTAGQQAVREINTPDGRQVATRWQRVDYFYNSTPSDRHYLLDPAFGKIQFGDGLHGRIPPEGRNNIQAALYTVGSGAESNVGVNTITVMRKSIPFISKVWNPVPAEGGADAETVDEAKLRAPHLFKHRFRAVTADDYEWLAKEASSQVARARCLPAHRREGEVTIVIVPKAPGNHLDLRERLEPSRELLRRVTAYLDERRLLTSRLHVIGLAYADLGIQAEIAVKTSTSEGSQAVKTEVEKRIREFLHPLTGGPDGQGWPFGMAVGKSDLYIALEKVPGVHFVSEIRLMDLDSQAEVEKLVLEPRVFAFPAQVQVTEKRMY